jgi:outer membrane protein TolC
LAGIHWRLFDFGKVDAEVAAARGEQAEALSRYRQTVLRAAKDVEDALSALAKVDAQERRWQKVVGADADSWASIGRSFRAGASSMVDVLQRERALLVARRVLSILHVDRARATVEVFRALGGGWPLSGETSPMMPHIDSSSSVTAAFP